MQPVWIVSRSLHYRQRGSSVSSYPKDILRVMQLARQEKPVVCLRVETSYVR